MRSKSQKPTPSSFDPHRWRSWWIAGGLLIVALCGYWPFRPSPATAPPTVNTAGFDPLVAAAIDQAQTGVRAAPEADRAWGRLGMVLLAHEIRPQAAECFGQASNLARHQPRWPYLQGLALMPDNPAAAVTAFQRAVREFPDNETVPCLRLADTLLALGRTTDAEKEYRAALRRDPKCAWAQLGLARATIAGDRVDQAAGFLAAAQEDPCTRKTAHRLLVNVCQRLGQTNEAARAAQALAELPPDQSLADPYLAEVEQLKTGEAAWIDRSDEWIRAGHLSEAAALLEKTIQTYPQSDRALFLLGRVRYRQGDLAGAESILTQAAQLAPNSVEALVQLGIVQLARGHGKDAQHSFRSSIRVKPNLFEAWFNLGLSFGNDNRTESIAAFRTAIQLKPNSPEAYLALALVLRADGQKQAALAELRQALSLQPEERFRQRLSQQIKLLEKP